MSYKELRFPENSTFLVTGGAGFIGSNLCEAILNMGYPVRCLDDLSTGKVENILEFLKNPLFEFIKGDITDYETCLMATKNINYVLHQAGWGSVPRSIEMPLIYCQNNILGTVNMMEASVKNKVKKFVYASSSSVYGDEAILPNREGYEGDILSPYALTKQCNEEWGRQYKLHYGLDTYGLRYFNVFGRRQNPNGEYAAVIPKIINQLKNNEQPTINGNGQQSRDFTYIENVIDANLKACLAPSEYAGQSFNIGGGEREHLMYVYRIIRDIMGKSIEPFYAPDRAGDIKHSWADISKARNCLNYFPAYTFRRGIVETIDWYMKQ